MRVIDGSMGEGGGQILRTALALSLVTGEPIRIEKIRRKRSKPGLMRQHLTAVQAAARISEASVEGAMIGSTQLEFRPGEVRAGDHHFAVGTAGSASLVLQTVLPALLLARGRSSVVIEGGTHNPLAPPFEALQRSFVPVLERMGAKIELSLERPGFYPAGGGRLHAVIEESRLRPIEIFERGAARSRTATALLSGLPGDIARRELDRVRERLGFSEGELHIRAVKDPLGPGNVLSIELEYEHVTEVVSAFGERGVLAEAVADRACDEAQAYLASEAPIGVHLADQLLLPMVLARGGAFRTVPLSEHARTQIELLRMFTDLRLDVREVDARSVAITVG
jgi:RNA 3'-terminal phosphate cyclase (ATP)